jgi:hypothetical protein
MSSLDPFVNCLNERVAGGPFKISKELTGAFRDRLISDLYKNSGNFTLNDFLDFLKIFSADLDDKNKKIIGDLEKPKDRKWWADVLGMDLKTGLDKLIVRDYEAIFNPGKKRIMGFQIQGKIQGLKDCLNEELESKKPRGSPLSGVSSPDLSSESEPEPELEPEPVPMKRKEERRRDPEDGKMYTKREFEENYGDTEEWDEAKSGIDLLTDPEWTYRSLGLGRNRKTKKRKKTKKKKRNKNKKHKKTKRRTKR